VASVSVQGSDLGKGLPAIGLLEPIAVVVSERGDSDNVVVLRDREQPLDLVVVEAADPAGAEPLSPCGEDEV
jgi:hypothetical protein